MHDHNLDDLIVNHESEEPKEKKTRSILTILALLIIVLIITIVLTKMILKDPNVNDSIVQENETELLNPELILENLIQNKEITDEDTEDSQDTLELALSQNEDELIALENDTTEEENVIETKKETSAEPITTQIKEEEKSPTPVNITPVPATNNTGNYYIQVGSFKNSPNKRYLANIKKNGFNYKLIFSRATQTKKLLIGPYSTRANADKAIISVKSRINKGAFIIKR